MLEHKKIRNLADYFVELNARQDKGVYFYRINGYTDEIGQFIRKYYEAARRTGVVIEGKIPNPDEKNLAYYSEVMGMDFRMEFGFILSGLQKWLPRMNGFQRESVAGAIYRSLDDMHRAGKAENILKNTYIKFMCWLYYKFERVINQLGENNIPKILYEGDISNYELMLISILSNAGCDVVLLQYHGDQGYLKLDPNSAMSDDLKINGMKPFPEGFCIKQVRDAIQQEFNNERLYGIRASVANCTNAWIEHKVGSRPMQGEWLGDMKKNVTQRGSDPRFFYNCFFRVNGAEDKTTYVNDLFQLQQELRGAGRRLVIVNGGIPKPTPEEIAGIARKNYTKQDEMLLDLGANIKYGSNIELQRLIRTAFVDVLLSAAGKEGSNLNRLTNKAVYLLCWLKRYLPQLFANWKMPEIGCFIYLGGCKNDNEALFLSLLARLPADVLILCPNLNTGCCLEDKLLYELKFSESLNLSEYPEEKSQIRMGTVAYHAERDLDTLMYQDTGMFRNQQYSRAKVINLQTMYEEIKILWDQELKYRPGFQVTDGVVNIPVIFAKVSGVKDGDTAQYWKSVRELVTEDTVVVRGAPYIAPNADNPMKAHVTDFYRNGRLQKNRIKNHVNYPYGILREDIQELILDKLETIIEQRLIKGIGENGMEYAVMATVLNLPKEIVRLIQKFDFTKKNPKMIYINAAETVISLEDSIVTAFLNLIGFDVIFFVPTGYQSIERHFNRQLMEEHQIGEYQYDLQVPDLKKLPTRGAKPTWRDKIFRRGN